MTFTTVEYNPTQLDNNMVEIPAGQVTFGLTATQKKSFADAAEVHCDMLFFHAPQQELSVDTFWLDKHPVTRGQFLQFMEKTGYKIPYNGWLVGWSELLDWQTFHPDRHALPMVGVNVEDANAYATWLGKRLPTDVEWERAWRGDDGRLFPWGNDWQEGFCLRNPGNLPLGISIPIGAYADTGPFALGSYGLVSEWVQVTHPALAPDGSEDVNTKVLAGGSFVHCQPYSFLPTNRLSWSEHLRSYASGFRCASDRAPKENGATAYRVADYQAPQPVSIRRELYLQEKIKLRVEECATIFIDVPWFTESVWVLDCPEGNWDIFGGANARDTPESNWRIPWQTNADGTKVWYDRKNAEKRVSFAAWVEEDTVKYHFTTEGIAPVASGSFCFKTFSPFFSSQERLSQVRLEGDKLVHCSHLPLVDRNESPSTWSGVVNKSFGWSTGNYPDHTARPAMVSYDGKAQIVFMNTPCSAYGNGWVPCTHTAQLENEGNVTAGEGSFQFRVLD